MTETDRRPHPFPMIRGGGLFVICMGLGITVGGLLGEHRLVVPLIGGAVLAFILQSIFARRLTESLGKPTRTQVMTLVGAIILEFILTGVVFLVFKNDFASGASPRNFWLWILLVVGSHFLIIAVAQGPLMLVLGLLCIINAIVGLLVPNVSLAVFWFTDGLLKIIVGALMLMTRPPKKSLAES